MRVSLYLAATLALAISSASARPALNEDATINPTPEVYV